MKVTILSPKEVACHLIRTLADTPETACPVSKAEKSALYNYLRSLGYEVNVVSDNFYYLESQYVSYEFMLREGGLFVSLLPEVDINCCISGNETSTVS